jgi:hypothetical protein
MSALDWIVPLRGSLPELGPADWAGLERFDAALTERCPSAPAAAADPAGWSWWLVELRRALAVAGVRWRARPVVGESAPGPSWASDSGHPVGAWCWGGGESS